MFVLILILSFIASEGPSVVSAGSQDIFPSGDPAALGINPKALARFTDQIKAAHSDSLVVIKDGRLINEWYSEAGQGTTKAPLIESMSITKSMTSLAIGRLVDKGRIKSIDEPVCRFFPEWDKGSKKRVTLRHLLSHTSCLEDRAQLKRKPPGHPDLVRVALESGLVGEPGTCFSYNNSAANLLSGIVRKVSGKRLDLFVRDEIFAPLGIANFTWTVDGRGNALGMIGLQIGACDLARIGQMMLQGGRLER